jgi:hypothetical protein
VVNETLIRRSLPDEGAPVRAVAQTVVDEIFGGLWAPPPLRLTKEYFAKVGDTVLAIDYSHWVKLK